MTTTKTKEAPRSTPPAQIGQPAAVPANKPHRREIGSTRLVKIANARVSRALRAIHLVGSIGSYQPTTEQSFAILEAMRKAVADAEARIKNEGKVVFQLPLAG
jgi:hypothetical protein